MSFYDNMFSANRDWVAQQQEKDPKYFKNLAKGQAPPVLYIGCSDSRLPPDALTGTKPGELFVHRNIANMVVHTDINLLSVMDYAINVLKVKHVVIAGHYECGGVKAAMGKKQVGLIDNWLRNIKDVYRLHQDQLNAIEDENQRFRRFVELNVQEQVLNLAKTTIVQNAWGRKQELHLHGWVIDIATGLIHDQHVSLDDNQDVFETFKMESI
jgi:carbonic anhydrase